MKLSAKRRAICIRPTVTLEKKLNQKEENIWSQKIRSAQEKSSYLCQGKPFSKKDVRALQVSTAISTSEATPTTSSAFSTKQILSQSVHKSERSLPSSPQKKADAIGTLPKSCT